MNFLYKILGLIFLGIAFASCDDDDVINPSSCQGIYYFDPVATGIVEGIVSDSVAKNNKDIINAALQKADSMGCPVFSVPEMDAFFCVNGKQFYNPITAHEDAIQIPAGIHFLMHKNTILRVQPNPYPTYSLLSALYSDSITISGGTLIGDMYAHDYSTYTAPLVVTHEWGNLMHIAGCHHVKILGVIGKEATGDALVFGNTSIRNTDGTLPPGVKTVENALVQDCIFDNNRRQAMSVIDGDNIVIDNNQLINTGKDLVTLPGCGIDLEAYRERDANGTLLEYQKITNVVLSNNTFFGNYNVDILVFTAEGVEIMNNTMTKGVVNNASANGHIHHNTITSAISGEGSGIALKSVVVQATGEQLVHDWLIEHNTISDFQYGIHLGGDNITVNNNMINNCRTISMNLKDNLNNALLQNNIITSNVSNSFGYRNFFLATSGSNITLTNETVNVPGEAFYLSQFTGSGTGLTATNCTFNGGTNRRDVEVKNSSNIELINCTYTNVVNTGNTNVSIP